MKSKKYILQLKCVNCGHQWKESFTRGHMVKYGILDHLLKEYNEDEYEIRIIECPKCGVKGRIQKIF